MTAPAATRRRGLQWPRFRRGMIPWLFIAPAMLVFLYFKFIPMFRGIELSFFDVGIIGDNEFVGFENFERALGDPGFHAAFWHTVLYVAVTVSFSAVIAFAMALLLEGTARHLRILRTAIFLPVVAAVAVVAEVWRILYWPTDTGLINQVLGLFGMPASGFLSDPNTSLGSIMAMHVWKSAPYDMVIFVAGLAGVNRELYEAADLDGASRWQRIRNVTIPSIRPVITIVLTLGIIRGFKVFTEVYVLTAGGPAGSSDVLLTFIYRNGLERLDIGYASAASTLVFLLTASLTGLYLWWSRRREAS